LFICKALKDDDNRSILDGLQQHVIKEDNNPLKNTVPKSGKFTVNYLSYFKNNMSRSNFCYRHKTIIDFPRHCNSSCKININYQYRQFTRGDHPFVKIVAFCENGPCYHEYRILRRPESKECSVEFKIYGIFVNDRIETPMHDVVSSSPLKGEYRERVFHDTLVKGTMRTYFDCLNSVNEIETSSHNLTSVISPSVIRNLASERLKDAHLLDNIKEAVELRRHHEHDPLKKFPGMLRNIVQDPYAVYSYTEEQLSIFVKCVNESSWENPIQLAFDTSGDIFPPAKTVDGKKKFYNFALCLSLPKMKNLPLGEMLTLKVDSKNVNCFLTNFVCDIEKYCTSKLVKLPQVFVTDYTWVNIHPILNVFFKTDIHKYLEEKFEQYLYNKDCQKSVLLLDKLHLIKFFLFNCRKIAVENYVAETFIAVFLYLLKCRSKESIEEMWISIIKVFCCKSVSEAHRRKIEEVSAEGGLGQEPVLNLLRKRMLSQKVSRFLQNFVLQVKFDENNMMI
jgi:hypothetical protein